MTESEQSAREAAVAALRERRARALAPAGEAANERQHARGKRTARERIEALVDEGSFTEFDRFAVHRTNAFGLDEKEFLGDGVVTGRATIDGRQVFLFSQDFTVLGGSLGEAFAEKICKVMDLAVRTGSPMIGINDSGGARIQEGVVCLGGYAEIFWRNVQASGVIPQISLIAGPCAGGAVYSPAITDFIIMTEKISQMFITGPEIIKTVTGEDVTFEELGGAMTHATKSGVAHLVAADEDEHERADARAALVSPAEQSRRSAALARATTIRSARTPSSTTSFPTRRTNRTTCTTVIEAVVDDGDFFEIQPLYAQNIICGFGRDRRPQRRHRRQSAERAGRRARHRLLDQSRALRPLLRCLQHPALDLRRRARASCPAPRKSTAASSCTARSCSTPLPRRRPEDHGDHAQGLRRRLRRHGLQTHPRRLQRRLADRRDRGDGRRQARSKTIFRREIAAAADPARQSRTS